ncbi:MAG: MFS transporter [Defluviitaleaceae bacterium]|nr:MFS transporter [Defluviitaleaceae bacterium]
MAVNQTERKLRLAFAVCVLIFAGIIYVWTILNKPFAENFGWDEAQLGWNYTLTIMFFCLGCFASGRLTNLTTPRFRFIAAAVLLSAGFFLTSRLEPGDAVWKLYLAYGIMSGTGIGLVYMTIIGLTNAWFPDKPGLSSGIMLMGFGLTTLVIGGIADKFISASEDGWRMVYTVLAAVLGAIFIAASVIVKPPPEGTVFPEAKSKKKLAAHEIINFSPKEMLRRPSFYLLFAQITLIAAVGSAAIAFARPILQTEFFIESPAGIIGAVSICNGLGRLTLGALFDRLTVRRTQLFISSVALSAPAAILAGIAFNSLPVGVIGLMLCYFSYGFAPTMGAIFSQRFYGPKNFAQNFSILNLILVPAPFVAPLAGALYNSSGTFFTPFAILSCFAIAGAVISLFIKKA